MSKEETVNRALKDNDLHALVGFEGRDDRGQRGHVLRTDDVQWRDIQNNAPVSRGAAFKADLLLGSLSHICVLR
jgi:hypothetical protein